MATMTKSKQRDSTDAAEKDHTAGQDQRVTQQLWSRLKVTQARYFRHDRFSRLIVSPPPCGTRDARVIAVKASRNHDEYLSSDSAHENAVASSFRCTLIIFTVVPIHLGALQVLQLHTSLKRGSLHSTIQGNRFTESQRPVKSRVCAVTSCPRPHDLSPAARCRLSKNDRAGRERSRFLWDLQG